MDRPLTALLLLSLPLLAVGSAARGLEVMTVRLANHSFAVELANTPQQRATGLMHRQELPEGSGMLFVYDRPQSVRFWNKNVAFPIDILYFDDNRRLLRTHAQVPPCLRAECPSYRSPPGVQLVLELPGGTAARLQLAPGAPLEFIRSPAQTPTGTTP